MTVATTTSSEPTSLLGGTPSAGPEGGAPPAGGAPAAPTPPAWLEGYPDDLKGEKALHSYKTPQDVAKALVETKRLVGASLRLPAKDAKPEEWDALHAKLRPETPEAYTFEAKPEAGWDADFQADFKKMAHETGMSVRQAQRVAAWLTEELAPVALPADAPARAPAEAALKREFGAEFTPRLEGAARFMEAHGTAEEVADFKRRLDATGLGNHPVLIRAFAAAGLTQREHQTPSGSPGGSGGMALAEAKALLGNQKSAYHDATHEDHVRVRREVDAAYARAFPGQVEAS